MFHESQTCMVVTCDFISTNGPVPTILYIGLINYVSIQVFTNKFQNSQYKFHALN